MTLVSGSRSSRAASAMERSSPLSDSCSSRKTSVSSTRVTDAPQLWEDRLSVRYRHPPVNAAYSSAPVRSSGRISVPGVIKRLSAA